LAAVEIDAADRPALPAGGGDRSGYEEPAEVEEVEVAALVAEVEGTVGSECRAVRTGEAARDVGDRAVGLDPADHTRSDLADHERPVGQHHRTLGEAQAPSQLTNLGHRSPPSSMSVRPPSSRTGRSSAGGTDQRDRSRVDPEEEHGLGPAHASTGEHQHPREHGDDDHADDADTEQAWRIER